MNPVPTGGGKMRTAWKHAVLTAAILLVTPSVAPPAALATAAGPQDLSNPQLDPIPPAESLRLIQPEHGLFFAWGVRVEAPEGVDGFAAYASRFSLLRTRDGRYYAVAFAGDPPSRVAHHYLGATPPDGIPTDDRRTFQPPQRHPDIPGHEFLGGSMISSDRDAHRFVGLWRGEGETVIASFDEARIDGRPEYEIIARSRLPLAAISGDEPLHGGPLRLRLVTNPGPDGRFEILEYQWRR